MAATEDIEEDNIIIADEFETENTCESGEKMLEPSDCRVISLNQTPGLSVFQRM